MKARLWALAGASLLAVTLGGRAADHHGVGSGGWTPEGEAARQEINRFIRASGAFDSVLDFDKVLADPADPLTIRADYTVGDHLHGNDAGYKALADSIDLSLFPR